MAASAPVEVGAQGTIGSLVCREIEYFRRMEEQGPVAVEEGRGRRGILLAQHLLVGRGGEAAGAARVRYRPLGQDEGVSLPH
ncbi:hypothetical protein E2562_006437 [Oryza meyeriana var. granulata]|uniref:Uncharacterized protein n=1 Tax=Oryza meyeriana var. granulata TaxID=110450 RepID=A0A6G1CQ68_9ORYZ|nr:hypothetical protein E2562_006437 [Oryza meyeriana var. granulata]